jgi:nucleoside 2-deoxyribosyltransferase
MKLYLAAPLFTAAERAFNAALAQRLRARGYAVWLPQENEPRHDGADAIFDKDVEGVDWCDAVIGNMDGPDPDSGTAWECGYAFATAKLIVVFRSDMRGGADGGLAPFNIMLARSAHRIVEMAPFADIEQIASAIDHALRDLAPRGERMAGA